MVFTLYMVFEKISLYKKEISNTNYNLFRRINMYITKIIERFGSSEMVGKSIDELCNKMDEDGYSLVTYQFCANDEKIMLTFKK